ncbi:MAG: metalloregulator ArsR/SmtB family transcription factor [Lachnospiraceae bacterium]|nr:metalloregulator ArsR/SmtB family transcription factor [Lachnospiraceae bacterium]
MLMNDRDIWDDLADLFKVFGDGSRIRILYELLAGERCVQELADSLDMTQSAVSHQLKVLKMSKLVRNRREGRQIYYALADDHVSTILAMGKEHIEEER